MEENYAIELRHISKSFPGIKANDDISINLKKGEIHALLGENGAGKSTLMSILFGLYQPDEGEIYVNGEKTQIKNPNDATSLHIGMVHQHFKLVGCYTALENIILGHEPTKFGFLRPKVVRKEIEDLCKEFNFTLDLDQKVDDMPVGSQQKVEILKMLYRKNDILIFDEPTAVLTPQEIEELIKSLKRLKNEGKSILFISHKLNEIMEVSDRVSVLRKGKCLGTFETASINVHELSNLMVGREVNLVLEKSECKPGKSILTVKDLVVYNREKKKDVVHNISFNVRAGEIVCIAGIEGNGQTDLVYALTGLEQAKSGEMIIHNVNSEKYVKEKEEELKQNKHARFVMKRKAFFAKNFWFIKVFFYNLGYYIKLGFSKFGNFIANLFRKKDKKKEFVKPKKLTKDELILKMDPPLVGDVHLEELSVRERNDRGLSHIPEDRHKYGLILDFNLRDNEVLDIYYSRRFQKYHFIKEKSKAEYAQDLINKYDVRSGKEIYSIVRGMSGGNQQKAIVARELERDTPLLIAVQPTRGVDVGAIEDIHHHLLDSRDKGNAILLISLELDEVFNLADRILVMYNGEITGEFDPKNVTANELGLYMSGAKKDVVHAIKGEEE